MCGVALMWDLKVDIVEAEDTPVVTGERGLNSDSQGVQRGAVRREKYLWSDSLQGACCQASGLHFVVSSKSSCRVARASSPGLLPSQASTSVISSRCVLKATSTQRFIWECFLSFFSLLDFSCQVIHSFMLVDKVLVSKNQFE